MRDEGTELKEINLRDLTRRYRDNGPAAEALLLLSSMSGPELEHLLRDHRFEGIYDALEVQRRNAADELLTFYGRIEIAGMVGFVPDPLPGNFREAAAAHLSLPAMERYYSGYYPLLLPGLLMRRLVGRPIDSIYDSSAANALFLEFMDTVSLIEGDSEVDRFLWLLDDGRSKQYRLDDVLMVLKDQEGFLAALTDPDEDGRAPTPVTQAVRGLREYLLFCSNFDSLLQRAAAYPLLQGAFWHDQAYWFIRLRDRVRSTLLQAVDSIAAWGASDTEGNEGLPELRGAITRLISGHYGRALEDAAGVAVAPPGDQFTKGGVSIHIGVNHPAAMRGYPLSQSEDTAWKMAELAFQAGYQAIHVLRGPQATRHAVGALLTDAAHTLLPGETLFVSFSGHCLRVRDAEGDSRDGGDEAWCLHDADLVDDELAKYWKLLAPGTRALVVVESRFGGGSGRLGHDDMAQYEARRRGAAGRLVYRSGGDPWRSEKQVVRSPSHDDGIQASVLMLAAASESQYAREGLYTRHLLEVWDGGRFHGSFRDLHQSVCDRIQSETQEQAPQILMLGAPDPEFPLETAFHLDRQVMRGPVRRGPVMRGRGGPL
jgi:hypothetical protein